MKRRTFLQRTLQAGAISALPGCAIELSGQASDARQNSRERFAALPPNLIGPMAESGYFTDAALHEALNTYVLNASPRTRTVVYNFPSWHPSPWMEARFGKGWTEFDTSRNAKALFPGHTMPHYPLWGYYNEAEPEWAAREIDLAADHGVDAWLVDWYWHEGTQFYQEQLEQGFLKAANRTRLKFAIMWANHDWKNVYPARSPDQAATMLPMVHTLPDFEEVVEYCATHYFHEPNYLRVDDAPLFTLFDAGKVIQQLGEDGLKRGLDLMRVRATQLGFPKLHLQVANGYDLYESKLKAFGFDSATQYGTFAWTYGSKPAGSRIPYGVGCKEAVASWQHKRDTVPLPFYPCVSVGWDDSPRFEEFAAIAINRSPDQFERLLRAARHSVTGTRSEEFVYIAAWNEWTEDHVLLPDTTWGYSYLEALKRVVRA